MCFISKKLSKELIPFYSHFSATTDDFQRSYRPSKLCSDLAFWKDKCLDDSQNAVMYRESRRCKTYEHFSYQIDECQHNEVYCPNKAKCLSDINKCQAGLYFGNEIHCQNHSMFHCHESNQCIWQDWVCDGFVQCLQGEDEDFDLCYQRGSFAEGAMVKCAETKRFSYNVMILATKCNGVVECADGSDEDQCENDDSAGLIAIGILLLLTSMIWIAIYMKYGNNEVLDKPTLYDSNLINIKGDQLASLKVKDSHHI